MESEKLLSEFEGETAYQVLILFVLFELISLF